jgi:hypothetical protein
VGKPVRLNGEPYVVVGILPPTFLFRSAPTDLVVPLVFDTRLWQAETGGDGGAGPRRS